MIIFFGIICAIGLGLIAISLVLKRHLKSREWKYLAFLAFAVFPVLYAFGVMKQDMNSMKQVDFCGSCHVMTPYVASLTFDDDEDAPSQDALEQLGEGDFRDQAGRLDLGQELAADASVNVYFLTDLAAALERYGNRGYRMAQMEASIMGGRLYLGAYAQRLGATGLTFFDDDVSEFFSPHAQGKSVMFLTALGRPMRRGEGRY